MSGAAYWMNRTELADAIGSAAADALMARMGGTKFYVAERLSDDSPIIAAIGAEAAAKLAEYVSSGIGGLMIEIPRGPDNHIAEHRRRLAELARTPGLTEAQIAQRMGVSARTVRRMRAKAKAEQLSAQA